MPTNQTHLQCINGHYRYRRRWPKHVRSAAKGEFFIRHLGTSSLAEALRLRPTAELEFYSEVDRLSGLVDAKPREVSQAEATILVSRWFAEQVRKEAEHGLHSFRHNFQDRLREAGLHATALGQELAGRSKGGNTSNNYGSGFPTAMLAEAVAKIAYPGLVLPPTS